MNSTKSRRRPYPRETLAAFSLADTPDRHHALDEKRWIVQTMLLQAIHVRLDDLERRNPALGSEALQWCWRRIREEGPALPLTIRATTKNTAREIAKLTGIDADLCGVVFEPSRAQIVLDELRRFAAHVDQRRRA